MLNFGRRYSIKIGVPEIEKVHWVYQCAVSANNAYQNYSGLSLSSNDSQILVNTPYKAGSAIAETIPSDAYLMSNLEEDGNSLRGFDFSFTSKRSMGNNPNKKETSTLIINNLPSEVEDLLYTDGCLVQVEAGYKDGNLDLYYIGSVERVAIRRTNDKEYTITLKDAGTSIKNTKASIDFAEKDSVADIVTALGKLLGLSVAGESIALEKLKKVYISGGFSFEGDLFSALKDLARRYKIDLSIFNGQFFARMKDIIHGSADYNKLAKNTWTFEKEDNNVLEVVEIRDTTKTLSTENKAKSSVAVTTFLIPASFDEFFTLPKDIADRLAGTYKVSEITYVISSTGRFNTVLKGEQM